MIPARNQSFARRLACVCLLVAAALLPVTCRQTPVTPAARAPLPAGSSISLSDWMSAQNPDTLLSALSIPGAHDAAATHEPLAGTAACQTLALAEQLALGIRFLDIRCRHVRDSFAIYHGVIDQQLTFDQVEATCRQFLTQHPTECIIMSLKEESTAIENTRSFAQTFDNYVAPNPTLWYLADGVPTLRQAAGKIILFRRFSAPGPNGLDASRWPDNRTFTIAGTAPMRVQDHYIVPDNAAKWTDISGLLDEARTGSPETLFINFTSGYHPALLGIPDIPTVAHDMHDRLAAYFKENPSGHHGIILLDFASPTLCAAIIRSNIPPAKIH
jgi:1-phosphatidylinositol phosphodiesterase